MSNFPCSFSRNITPHSMENLAFHSLLKWKMIILQILATPLIHSYSTCWENVLFEPLGVKGLKLNAVSQNRANAPVIEMKALTTTWHLAQPIQQLHTRPVPVDLGHPSGCVARVVRKWNRGLVVQQHFQHVEPAHLRCTVGSSPTPEHARRWVGPILQQQFDTFGVTWGREPTAGLIRAFICSEQIFLTANLCRHPCPSVSQEDRARDVE